MRSPVQLVVLLLAVLGLLVAGCGGDDDGAADPTPDAIEDPDAEVTVPDDDDAAVGEPDDEDSQTDTSAPASGEDVVPESGTARVSGSFGERDLELLLEDAECAIQESPDAGGEAAAEVVGTSADGDFRLDWSTDAGTLRSTIVLEGVEWTVDLDLDDVADPQIELTRNGEVLMDTTYESADGERADAQLFVNCRPEA